MRDPLEPHSAAPFELQQRLAVDRGRNPFLLYRDGADRQVIVELDGRRDRLAIGRRSSSDVALTWDPEVSRVHASVERLGQDWVLCDEALSHNGTWINRERVHGRRRLQAGDVIAVGDTLICFCVPGGTSTAAATRTAAHSPGAISVTLAQRRVLVALCRPLASGRYAAPSTNREIAEELFVTVDTVKGTLSRLFELFGLDAMAQYRKRVALARLALETGVVRRDEL
jgi:pSer/pThr/pTyr-binding forkhead associated (FHA) protein